MQEYFQLVRKIPESIHSTSVQEEISENLVAKFTEHFSRRKIQQYTPVIKREIWHRIDQTIASPVGDVIRVKELCLPAQISEWTLHRYFHKRFSTSPKNIST